MGIRGAGEGLIEVNFDSVEEAFDFVLIARFSDHGWPDWDPDPTGSDT